jgi:hypothetical protein
VAEPDTRSDPITVEADFRGRGSALVAVRKRGAKRHRCPLAAPVEVGLPDGTHEDGWAHDLSETGIGLELGRPLERGTLVLLRLHAAGPDGLVQLAGRVAHATEAAGGWRVGCAFDRPLTPEQLAALLAW